ncbi:MAG: Trk system potassium transporter TrkA [Bacteroidales bacterium]|nr:Trk system potassium transporter TrkA [Bacteroidales bacterium]
MKIVIAGAGDVGTYLAKMLSSASNDIVIVDDDHSRLAAIAEAADVVTVEGDITDISVLKRAGVQSADLLVAVCPAVDQNVNIVCASLAKMLGCHRVTARIKNEDYLLPENKNLFLRMGVDFLFYPEKIASTEIADLLKRNSLMDTLDFARGKLSLSVFRLNDETPALEMNVQGLSEKFSSEGYDFRIIALTRRDETIIPGPAERFHFGDQVYILSKRESLPHIKAFLGKEDRQVESVVILGGSHIGELLARELCSFIDRIILVEISAKRCEELSEKLPSKVVVMRGDARNIDNLLEDSITCYDALVAVTDSSETNILSCVAAKKRGVDLTVAQVENLEYVSLGEGLGVDTIINKKHITAGKIFKFTLGGSIRSVKYMGTTNAEVLEYIAAPGSKITGKPLKDLNFPKKAIVGGYIHGGETYIAVGNSKISDYDRVVVFSFPETVPQVDSFFE